MKVIIDIPNHLYKLLKDLPSDSNEGTIENVLMKAVENGTPIPDNATNGDVIKAMFPTADISLNDSCFEGVVNKYGFDMKWWNAPYQKGE